MYSNKGVNMGIGSVFVLSILATSLVQAADNKVPSFWGGVSVKLTETYGNNNTKPLTGAKVTLDVVNAHKAKIITDKYPVIKFPMTRTSQTRGVDYTRIPPSNDIGMYKLTVVPNTRNGKYVCKPYPSSSGLTIGADGAVSKTFKKSSGPGTTRFNFGFKCQRAGVATQGGGSQSAANNNMQSSGSNCHDVKVQGMGAGARYGRVTLKSCKQSNGKWKIDPYSY